MPNFSAALAKISLHSVTIDLSEGKNINPTPYSFKSGR